MARAAEQRWYVFVVLGPASRQQGPWATDEAWAEEQTSFVRSLAPLMAGRRWFFRRSALDTEVTAAEKAHSMRLYVELLSTEAAEDLVRALATAMPFDWTVKSWLSWDRRFSDRAARGATDQYGSAEAQEIFMVGLCSALARSVATGSDPEPRAIGHWIEELLGTRDPQKIARLLRMPTA
jgi:hypothetical protein